MGAGASRPTRRGRARIGVVAIAVWIVATALWQIVPAAGAPSAPSTDLRTYVVFGFSSLSFKGAEAAGRGIISGGNAGTAGMGSPADPALNICNAHPAVMDPGTQLVGNTAAASNLGGECKIYDFFANHVGATSDPLVPLSSGPTSFAAPLTMTHVPAFTTPVCTAPDKVVDTNTTTSMAPGTYGNVQFKDGSTVTLAAGKYTICGDFTIAKTVTVLTSSGTEIDVAGGFNLGNSSTFGNADACDVWIMAGGDTIQFGKADSSLYGHVYAPNANLGLGNHSNLFGSFWADIVHSDMNVVVMPCGPNEQTTTSTSTTSTSTTTVPETSMSSTTTTSTTTTTVPGSTSTSTSTTSTTIESNTTEPQSTTVATEGSTATSAPTTSVPETVSSLGNLTTTTAIGPLPRTGSAGWPPRLGLVSLGIGGVLLLISRRRAARTT